MCESYKVPAGQFVEIVDAAGELADEGHRDLAAKLRRQINVVMLNEGQFHRLMDAARANQEALEKAALEAAENAAEEPPEDPRPVNDSQSGQPPIVPQVNAGTTEPPGGSNS
jgi:hypothetical protein